MSIQRKTLTPSQVYEIENSSPAVTNLGWRQIDYDPDPRPENYLPPDQPYLVGRPCYVPRRADPNAPPEPSPYDDPVHGIDRFIEDRDYDRELRLRYPLLPELAEEERKRMAEELPGVEPVLRHDRPKGPRRWLRGRK